jgi:hypothetical protein
MLRPHTGKPNHLLVLLPINKHISRKFVPAQMRNEKDAYATRPRIICITIKPQWPKMALEFAFYQRRCNSAARISSSVRAE